LALDLNGCEYAILWLSGVDGCLIPAGSIDIKQRIKQSKTNVEIFPRIIIIAGPIVGSNSAGEMAFAREFLPKKPDVRYLVMLTRLEREV
jgi:hypothetical protein